MAQLFPSPPTPGSPGFAEAIQVYNAQMSAWIAENTNLSNKDASSAAATLAKQAAEGVAVTQAEAAKAAATTQAEAQKAIAATNVGGQNYAADKQKEIAQAEIAGRSEIETKKADAALAQLKATSDRLYGEGKSQAEVEAALEALRNSGAKALVETQGGQQRETIGSQSAADLALETLKTSGARTLGQDRAAAEMAQLEKTIAAQGGESSKAQQAEMARLQAQLQSQASESAAERLARLEELRQTQSGTKELAGYQSTLQKQLEDARFARAQQENEQAFGRSQQLLTRFGFGTDASGATNAPAWLSSLVGPSGGVAGPGGTASATAASGSAGGGDSLDAQDKAVEDAVWARAKDKIGLSNEAAKRGLSEDLAARGIKGSGVEAEQLGTLEASGTGQLASTATQAALETLKRKYQVRDSDKALASQKRGQDIGLISSLTGSYRPSASGGAY